MDKSPEYIAMCDSEIQERWNPAVGDWTDKGVIKKISGMDKEFLSVDDLIGIYEHQLSWLPLQWQLQEMVKADAYRLDFKYNKYTLTLYPYKYDGQFVFTSPTAEQALLRGWFYWRYGKRWTGKKWKR